MLRFGWIVGVRADTLDQIDRPGNLAERIGQARLDFGGGDAQVASDQSIVERLNVIEQEHVPRLLAKA
jgi:hypothetical protein